MLLVSQLFAFFVSAWLAVHLLARNIKKVSLFWAGLGLSAYAFAIAVEGIVPYFQNTTLIHIQQIAIFLPVIFWTGSLFTLLESPNKLRINLYQFWKYFWGSFSLIFILYSSYLNIPFLFNFLITVGLLFFGFLIFIYDIKNYFKGAPSAILLIGTLFFALSISLMFPFIDIPREWVISAIGIDIALMGIGIAFLDGFDEGHNIKKDMMESLVGSFLVAAFFTGQVALVAFLAPNFNPLIIVLLFTSILSGTLVHSYFHFSGRNAFQLDSKNKSTEVLSLEKINKRSNQLLNESISFEEMAPKNFERFTRRAISYLDDFSKLSLSPLINHPHIKKRLNQKNEKLDSLSRTVELKLLLTECIMRLNPGNQNEFGTSKEWRYYNVLYFPYVLGLKPNRRKYYPSELSEDEKMVMEWFSQQVPARTLHNWQSVASSLIANQILEMIDY